MSVKKVPFAHVIGVVGLKAAGKDVFCAQLGALGYATLRLSDAIRHDMALDGKPNPSVFEMIEYSNRKKLESGNPGLWANKTLALAEERGLTKVLLNGIRNPVEIDEMHAVSKKMLSLVAIVAPINVRAERFIRREQAGDPSELAKFLELDDKDRGIGQPAEGQHVDRCIASVPLENVYNNSGTLEQFEQWSLATARRLYDHVTQIVVPHPRA